MRFWDSSAVLALLFREPSFPTVDPLFHADPRMVLGWATPIECESALARAGREGRLPAEAHDAARSVLEHLRERAFEVQPAEEVRARAIRMLSLHSLSAADALQLAAALVWCQERTRGAAFVCLDDRLRGAAGREGFSVLPSAGEINETAATYGAR